MTYRKDIEGLRAIAVAVVLLYHFGVPGLDGGFIGVDVFFVISGFLITSLLISERARHGRVSFATFYARRARRLLPISATVLVATAIGSAFLLPAPLLSDTAADIRWAALFAANILFARRGSDYLGAELAPSPLRHYWSLAVEEQFYVIWPALIALATLGARRIRLRVGAVMAVLIGASFVASVLLTSSTPTWAYYGLHTRAWELGLGALLAALAPQFDRVPSGVRAMLGWLGLAGVIVAACTFGTVAFPGWSATLPVLAAGALLVSGPSTPGSPAGLLSTPVFTYLGTRSYSLYLWHWPAIILAEAHLGHSLSVVQKVALAVGVFVVAELGFRVIEQPIRSSRGLAKRRALSISIGGALVVVGLIASAGLASYQPDLTTGVTATAPELLTPDTTLAPATTVAATIAETTTTLPHPPAAISNEDAVALDAVVSALGVTVLPDNLRPSLKNAYDDMPELYHNGCHQYYKTRVKTRCIFGDPAGTFTIAIWGDSHITQWYHALEAIAVANHWRIIPMTQGGCPFIDVEVYNKGAKGHLKQCQPWRDSARQFMRDEHVDMVFLSQYYAEADLGTRQPITAEQWNSQLRAVLLGLQADGIVPVVVGDVADPPNDVPTCLSRARQNIAVCESRDDDPLTTSVVDTIRSVTTELGVGFIDPTHWLCSDHRCPVVVGDILMYRDGHHLTTTAVLWLQPLLEQLIVPYVNGLLAYRAVTGA